MHFNHVWISSLRRLLTLQVFALLVCAPAAWSQTFGTNVIGQISSCGKTESYDKDGARLIAGTAKIGGHGACGSASAASIASLYPPPDLPFTFGVVGVSGQGGSGYATSLTYDYVVLKPPSSFVDDEVTFTMVDTYHISITGGTGSVRACSSWTQPETVTKCGTTYRSGNPTVTHEITLKKSTKGFQSDITKIVQAKGSFPGPAPGFVTYFTSGLPIFELPKGWTCIWASGAPCEVK